MKIKIIKQTEVDGYHCDHCHIEREGPNIPISWRHIVSTGPFNTKEAVLCDRCATDIRNMLLERPHIASPFPA